MAEGCAERGSGREGFKSAVFLRLIYMMLTVWAGTVQAGNCPPEDFNSDGVVNVGDLAVMMEQWLSSPGCEGSSCADLVGQDGVNLGDFSLMTGTWGWLDFRFTVNVGLPVVDGHYLSTSPDITLSGTAPACTTQAVRAGGNLAIWASSTGRWNIGQSSGNSFQTLIARNSQWYYLDNGSNQGLPANGANWYGHPDYVQTGWKGPSPAPLGYGDGDEATVIGYGPSTSSRYITSYFRKTFEVADAGKFTALTMRVQRDDGVVVYLNGNLVVRDRIVANYNYLTPADSPSVGGTDESTYYEFTVPASNLRNGTNLVAAEVHQQSGGSTDVSFDLELIGTINNTTSEPVHLNLGSNQVFVRTYGDQAGVGPVLREQSVEIVYQPPTVNPDLSGTLTQSLRLISYNGPWHVVGPLVVPAGLTLTIDPGAVLKFENSAGITVNGRLTALGTPESHIQLIPNAPATRWQGLRFANTSEPSKLYCVDMNYGDAQGKSIIIESARVTLDTVAFLGTSNRTGYLEINHPQALIRNCSFPQVTATEPLHGAGLVGQEYLIFEGNLFGGTSGYNDNIDFTGGQRPGPIVQFYDNTFLGGGDDGPDLDATDAHIEGNFFTNFHRTSPTQESPSYAVATGEGSQICVVRNVFYNNDHAVLHKEGVYSWTQNNTIIGCTIAAISFGEPYRNPPRTAGSGTFLDSNIFLNNAAMFEHYFDDPVGYGPTGEVMIVRSIVPTSFLEFGWDNLDTDPLLENPPDNVSLRQDSPARGTGQNGLDMGALVLPGASIAGGPQGVTTQTAAAFTVSGPGITHYKYRLVDNGIAAPWSSEIALSITPDNFPANPVAIYGPIELTNLPHGHTYRVEVIGKNSAGLWQGQQFRDTEFYAPGNPEGNSSQSWTVE